MTRNRRTSSALDRSAVHWRSQDRRVTLVSTAAGLVSPSAAAGPKRKHCRRPVGLGRGTPMDGFWTSSRIGRLLEQRKVPWKGNPRQATDSTPPPTVSPLQAARAVSGPHPGRWCRCFRSVVDGGAVPICRPPLRSSWLPGSSKPCRFRLRGRWCGGICRMTDAASGLGLGWSGSLNFVRALLPSCRPAVLPETRGGL